MRIYRKGKRTLSGAPIISASIRTERGYWRWIIRTATAVYMDGGNYLTEDQARRGLDAALDPGPVEVSRVMAALGARGGRTGGVSKVRGDAEHYRMLAAKSAVKRKPKSKD